MNEMLFRALAEPSLAVFFVIVGAFTMVFVRELVRLRLGLARMRISTRPDADAKEPFEDDVPELAMAANTPAFADNTLPEIARTVSSDPKHIVNINFKLLEKYYDQTLGDYRLNSRATVVVACTGFGVILLGVGLALAQFTAVGIVSTIAGLVSEAGTLLFFRQNYIQMKQVEEYHRKLVSTQYLLTAVSLAEGLGDTSRESEIKRIITNLLYLSNELHGSASPHLIGIPEDVAES